MAWDDVLAAVGGGLQGYEGQRRHQESQNLSQERIDMASRVAELRSMISQLQITAANDRAANAQAGMTARNTENNTTRATIAGQAETGRNTRATQADETRRRGQDLQDTQAWDASARWWEGDATSRRGQDTTATTARRGQDMTQGTAAANRHSLDAARGESYALHAYEAEIARRKAVPPSVFSTTPTEAIPTYEDWLRNSGDPEIFPSVQQAHGGMQPPRQISPAGADRGMPPAMPPAAPGAPPVAPPAAAPQLQHTQETRVAPVPARPGPAAPNLETQARGLIDKIKAADAAGQDSTALRTQLAAIRAQAK